MSTSAAPSGTFRIGGDLPVTRLGFGAMRITGKGVWGDPPDRGRALEVLRRLPELGVDFIDTADSYGPHVSEELIREALHPYDGITVATKAGLTRQGPDIWSPVGRPEYLRQCCLMSLRRLGVERIDLFQLHRIDPKVPRDEQFGVLAELQSEGLVRHLGLSEVSVADIEEAGRHFTVTTVQNRYNVADRAYEDVLEHCDRNGIGFIPWYPLAAGRLAEPGGAVAEVADRHGATPGQVALAWLLARSEVVLPIPGTGSPEHLEENVAAASLTLEPSDLELLDGAGSAGRG
ncbi:MAG TPA: aldo/keto reductase [Microthrixaceae bacterium]|nr:aldo/keto reductase [Microthrixaceae bacterium]